jgi:hypothetical protein
VLSAEIFRSHKRLEPCGGIPLEIVIHFGIGVNQAAASMTHEQFDKNWYSRRIHSAAKRLATIIKTPFFDVRIL